MAQLRKQVKQSCLVGCVGAENAGKTTLIRLLIGLSTETGGHLRENATANATARAMPLDMPDGLQVLPESPMLLDTPGMFDARKSLADCALRHQGQLFQWDWLQWHLSSVHTAAQITMHCCLRSLEHMQVVPMCMF